MAVKVPVLLYANITYNVCCSGEERRTACHYQYSLAACSSGLASSIVMGVLSLVVHHGWIQVVVIPIDGGGEALRYDAALP